MRDTRRRHYGIQSGCTKIRGSIKMGESRDAKRKLAHRRFIRIVNGLEVGIKPGDAGVGVLHGCAKKPSVTSTKNRGSSQRKQGRKKGPADKFWEEKG